MTLKKQFFRYIIPSIIALWVFSIYTIVDGFFVAHFSGVREFSAVSLIIPFVNSIFAIAIIFAVGTQTLIGIYLGKNRRDAANGLFSFIISFICIFSILLSIICLLNLNFIVRFLGATSELFSLSKTYLRVILLFSPFFIVSYTFEVLVKVDGYPTTAIFGAAISSLTNIILDYVFISILHMSVFGAALATGFAQVLSTFIFFIHFRSSRGFLRFVKFNDNIRFYFSKLKDIIFIGFGEFIAEFNLGAILFIFNYFIINYLNTNFIPSFSVINYITLFVVSTFSGICHGSTPLISFYYGAKKSFNNKKIIRYSFESIFFISIFMYVFFFFFGEIILNIFLDDSSMVNSSIRPLRIFTLIFLLCGYNIFIASISSAINRPIFSIIINLLRGSLFLIPSVFLILSSFGVRFIFFGAILSEFLTFIVAMTFYFTSIKRRVDS